MIKGEFDPDIFISIFDRKKLKLFDE